MKKIICIIFFLSSFLWGEQVHLKDKSLIKGDITAVSPSEITVKTKVSELRLSRNWIDRIITDSGMVITDITEKTFIPITGSTNQPGDESKTEYHLGIGLEAGLNLESVAMWSGGYSITSGSGILLPLFSLNIEGSIAPKWTLEIDIGIASQNFYENYLFYPQIGLNWYYSDNTVFSGPRLGFSIGFMATGSTPIPCLGIDAGYRIPVGNWYIEPGLGWVFQLVGYRIDLTLKGGYVF